MHPSSTQLHDFPGGLILDHHKAESTAQPIGTLPTPERVWIPLLQHRGMSAMACVSTGDRVDIGTLIATADGTFSANVHASISGVVGQISERIIAHRSGLAATCIEIIRGEKQLQLTDYMLPYTYHQEDPNLLRQRIADAGIVGLGGAAFPTGLKLAAEADRNLHTLVINGAECAPYISCDEMLMRERADDLVSGIQILLHVLQINRCQIALEEDCAAPIASLREALSNSNDDRLQLCLVHAKYPEGGERQLIQVLSGEEVPSNGLPVDLGYLCHNVGTAIAVHDAIINGYALTSRVVTVCGGVAQSCNLNVPFGAPVSELIEQCGGYTDMSRRLIIGGPMMGFTIPHDAVPIDKGCNAVLALPETAARPSGPTMPCIRCGACSDVCPASLLPQQLYFHAHNQQLDKLARLNLFDCIECGCCDYVCPSNLPLTEHFRYAKDEIWFREQDKQRANYSRTRYEQREQRLQRQQQQRDEIRAARRQAATNVNNRQAEIAAAVARAKARQQQDGES